MFSKFYQVDAQASSDASFGKLGVRSVTQHFELHATLSFILFVWGLVMVSVLFAV